MILTKRWNCGLDQIALLDLTVLFNDIVDNVVDSQQFF